MKPGLRQRGGRDEAAKLFCREMPKIYGCREAGVAGSKQDATGQGGGGIRKAQPNSADSRYITCDPRRVAPIGDKYNQANDLLGAALDNIVSDLLRLNEMNSKSPRESCLLYQQKYN